MCRRLLGGLRCASDGGVFSSAWYGRKRAGGRLHDALRP
jgi:hypothetical protein